MTVSEEEVKSYFVPTNKVGIPSGLLSLTFCNQNSTFFIEIGSIKEYANIIP